MKSLSKWLLSAVALAALASTTVPASAQRFGYGDDGPPPFRGGLGWDGRPHRGPWERWHHHRRWGDEGAYRRGWRDDGGRGWRDEGRGGRGRFGQDEGRSDGRQRLRTDDGRRQFGGDDGPRRGGPGRGGPGAFGGSDD